MVDAAGIDRFALLGISQGAAIVLVYAARHPERVTHLVLYGGYAEASWYDGVGHMPFLEDPARFDRELGQFVTRVR